jgi:hypothetical protein
MKQLLLLAGLLMPILLSAQTKDPKKDKSTVIALRALPNESENLEKGLAQHVKNYHSADGHIDVYEVLTGTHTGEYRFVYRTPASWADVETEFTAANDKSHADDWTENVAKYTDGKDNRYFYEISDDSYLPSDPSAMQAPLMGVYIITLKPGTEADFYAGVKRIKEMHKKAKSKDYYMIQSQVFGLGSQAVVIFPLPNGFASLEPNPNDDWSKMFKAAFPKEDYKAWSKKFEGTQEAFESFVVKRRADLSSQ